MDQLVVAATGEHLLSEDWATVMEICDRVEKSHTGPRECVVAISKRIPHQNQNVTIYALSLTEALTKNCGVRVHREISSRPFCDVLVRKLNDRDTHTTVISKILGFIELGTRAFGNDPSLGYMGDVYNRLKNEVADNKQNNVPDRSDSVKRKEQEDLNLAIAMSLSSAEASSKKQANTSSTNQQKTSIEPLRTKVLYSVKALYDFPGTDRGELSFREGDVIGITDCDYQDWWMGELRGCNGLIPSNYVEKIDERRAGSQPYSSQSLGQEQDIESATLAQIANVDKLLSLLAAIDPRRESVSENSAIQILYSGIIRAQPNAVKMLDIYTQKKDRLLRLSEQFGQARSAYERLMEQSLSQAQLQQPQQVHNYSQNYQVVQPQPHQRESQPYQPYPVPQTPTFPDTSQHQHHQQVMSYQSTPYNTEPAAHMSAPGMPPNTMTPGAMYPATGNGASMPAIQRYMLPPHTANSGPVARPSDGMSNINPSGPPHGQGYGNEVVYASPPPHLPTTDQNMSYPPVHSYQYTQ